MSLSKSLTAAAGNAAAGDNLYVEDVFSTYLYTGNSSTQTITNGLDLAGEGGMVWHKRRTGTAENSSLYDTERGVGYQVRSNGSNAQSDKGAGGLTSFNSDGFTYGTHQETGHDYVGWSFRKAEKFFDVVEYTGDGVTGRTVSHNLGSVPGFILVKCTSSAQAWAVYHRSEGAVSYTDLTTAPFYANPNRWNGTEPTESEFTCGNSTTVNQSGETFVAYLFAHDAGGFGDDGDENIIKCGSWDATGNNEIDLGFEPQWILIKNADGTNGWGMFDTMRGWTADGNIKNLIPNLSNAESSENGVIKVTSTGFTWVPAVSGNTYIYVAIRRPMKTPTVGTEVFAPTAYNGTEPTPQYLSTGFTVDFNLYKYRNLNIGASAFDRLRGSNNALTTSSSNAEEDISGNSASQILAKQFERNDGFSVGTGANNAAPLVAYSFKRAPGFFDVVAYTGTGVARTVSHNLNAVPELMIFKVRNRAGSSWVGYHKDLGNEGGFSLDSYAAFSGATGVFNSTTPNSSVFTVGTGSNFNGNTDNLIAYLFATLAGVSKVGSYTGTGADLNVDCGFSAGARFVLIKRTDDSGDWYTYDSVRGIISGNDPYMLLNVQANEVTNTDYIDPLASGFTVTSGAPTGLNASGGSYLFLAIA